MTGGADAVVFGRCDPATWHPDLVWLESALAGPTPPKMVVLVNPCNPTGAPTAWSCEPSGSRHWLQAITLAVLQVQHEPCRACSGTRRHGAQRLNRWPFRFAGVLLDEAELQRASQLCAAAGAWLVVDNTYEHFTYEGRQHHCVHGPHVINMFSFSKVGVLFENACAQGCFGCRASAAVQPAYISFVPHTSLFVQVASTGQQT